MSTFNCTPVNPQPALIATVDSIHDLMQKMDERFSLMERKLDQIDIKIMKLEQEFLDKGWPE